MHGFTPNVSWLCNCYAQHVLTLVGPWCKCCAKIIPPYRNTISYKAPKVLLTFQHGTKCTAQMEGKLKISNTIGNLF
jgi:hypothetical protein